MGKNKKNDIAMFELTPGELESLRVYNCNRDRVTIYFTYKGKECSIHNQAMAPGDFFHGNVLTDFGLEKFTNIMVGIIKLSKKKGKKVKASDVILKQYKIHHKMLFN
jgi:hypothetical protein